MKFDRSARLITRKDFEKVFQAAKNRQHGRALRRPEFVVYLRYSEGPPRLGISIAKKVVRKANKRNRMKRCLREYFRLHQELLSGDIIVRWLKSPSKLSFDELTEPLKLLINKQSSWE